MADGVLRCSRCRLRTISATNGINIGTPSHNEHKTGIPIGIRIQPTTNSGTNPLFSQILLTEPSTHSQQKASFADIDG